jgi:hypothetical protein
MPIKPPMVSAVKCKWIINSAATADTIGGFMKIQILNPNS